MRQKLALVVIVPPSVSLRRMKGFSPVRISRFGSRDIGFFQSVMEPGEPTGHSVPYAIGVAMNARALVARNIKRLRVMRLVSREALVVDAGIDRTYVSRLERGLENPTVAVLEQISEA